MSRTVWLLSAYRSDSHAYWVQSLIHHHPDIDWQVFELPGRHFAWRIRSNPLSWLGEIQAALTRQPPDLILASSMVDLATLKGLHPALAGIPSVYYFHENQLAYPIIPGQVRTIEPVMVQLYGALAADRVLFNSRFNRDSFLTGLQLLSRRLPDGVPSGLDTTLAERSAVLPVPVSPIAPGQRSEPELILWNHRWEHDKQPERFADALFELERAGRDFKLALLGPRARRGHPTLQRLSDHFGDRIRINAFTPRSDYAHWLGRASVVVSTAIHEFQGLSLLEAVSAGAQPVVPDALCYREQYPARCRYSAADPEALMRCLKDALDHPHRGAPDVSAYLISQLQPQWAELLQAA